MCSALQPPPLIPIVCFHSCCSPSGMRSSLTIMMTNIKIICPLLLPFLLPSSSSSSFLPPSFNLHIVHGNGWRKGELLSPCPAQSLNEKSCLRAALCGAGSDPGPISAIWIPPPAAEKSLSPDSHQLQLHWPDVHACWVEPAFLSSPTEHAQSQQPQLNAEALYDLRCLEWCRWLAPMTFSLRSSAGALHLKRPCVMSSSHIREHPGYMISVRKPVDQPDLAHPPTSVWFTWCSSWLFRWSKRKITCQEDSGQHVSYC